MLSPTKFFSNKAALFTYIHSNSNYSTNAYNDKHMQITIIVAVIWKLPAPSLIEYNFDEVGLVLISSHLIETLHCPLQH